jgi:CheY-like chemotaxis protein
MNPPSNEPPDFTNLRALVVDDLPTNLKVLSHLLEKLGVVVETCESGERALELCEKQEFHIILMDLHMPAMSGFETGEKIIAARTGPLPLVVAQTADETDRACERTKAIGFDGHLTKPIRPANVGEYLARALEAMPSA